MNDRGMRGWPVTVRRFNGGDGTVTELEGVVTVGPTYSVTGQECTMQVRYTREPVTRPMTAEEKARKEINEPDCSGL